MITRYQNSKKGNYRKICKVYFPRWKPWEFKYDRFFGIEGFCDSDHRTIIVQKLDPVLIIHEICHAVTDSGHEKKWQDRMLKAAITADTVDPEIASRIRDEVTKIQEIPHGTLAQEVYSRLSDAMLEFGYAGKEIEVDAVIEAVKEECGFHIKEREGEFERRCKRARAVALKAYREGKRERKRHDRFMEYKIEGEQR
jgi:hypothetical protein